MQSKTRGNTQLFSRICASFSLMCLLTLLQHGCQSIAPSSSNVFVPTESNFRVKGRLSVISSTESFKGSFDWTQQATNFSLVLRGTLGVGKVVIRGDDETVSVARGRDDVVEGISLQSMMEEQFGWYVPMHQLRRVLLGAGLPIDMKDPEFDEDGRLQRFVYREWEVTIDRYQAFGGREFPSRITLEQPATKIRLLIDRWLDPSRTLDQE